MRTRLQSNNGSFFGIRISAASYLCHVASTRVSVCVLLQYWAYFAYVLVWLGLLLSTRRPLAILVLGFLSVSGVENERAAVPSMDWTVLHEQGVLVIYALAAAIAGCGCKNWLWLISCGGATAAFSFTVQRAMSTHRSFWPG